MKIYLIAGPPGIGKSTDGKKLVPQDIRIVDQDLASYQYKKQGFTNYRDIAALATNAKIRELIFDKEDFAFELNLGFPSHYSFLRSMAALGSDIQIELILFYTDDINLCLFRAKIRHLSGGHEVTWDIIKEMYSATIPLFFLNKDIFQRVRLVDVTHEVTTELSLRSKNFPAWVVDHKLNFCLQR